MRPYVFAIGSGTGRGKRAVIPTIRDRVVQGVLKLILEPKGLGERALQMRSS